MLLEEVGEVAETQDVEVEVELENNSELLLKEDKTFEKTIDAFKYLEKEGIDITSDVGFAPLPPFLQDLEKQEELEEGVIE